jgi:hypothetical protein
MNGSPRRFRLPWFSEERKTWSRLPYRLRGIRCLPTGCHKCANTSKAFPRTHPSAFVANCGRKAVCCSIERPRDHPMRSYGNRGTGFIRRIRVASLCGAAQHVNHSGPCVRRLRLPGIASIFHGIPMGFMHVTSPPPKGVSFSAHGSITAPPLTVEGSVRA